MSDQVGSPGGEKPSVDLSSVSMEDLLAELQRRVDDEEQDVAQAMLKARTILTSGRLALDVASQVIERKLDEATQHVFGSLYPRERQVLEALGLGLSNPQIAKAHGTSTETVKTQVRNVLRKLGVSNRYQAAAVWREVTGLEAEIDTALDYQRRLRLASVDLGRAISLVVRSEADIAIYPETDTLE